MLASLAAVDRDVGGAVPVRGGGRSVAGGADGRTAGDGFFDQVLLVELGVGGLEVVIGGRDFDFLGRFVVTVASVAATASAAVASCVSARSGVSGVPDMVVGPHFVDLLG